MGGPRTLPVSPPCSTASLLQTVSINKAINAQEVAVKEKHARNILPKVGRGTGERGSGAGAARKRGSGEAARGEGCGHRRAGAATWLGVAGWDTGVLSVMVGGFLACHGVPAPAFARWWVPSRVLPALLSHGGAGGCPQQVVCLGRGCLVPKGACEHAATGSGSPASRQDSREGSAEAQPQS